MDHPEEKQTENQQEQIKYQEKTQVTPKPEKRTDYTFDILREEHIEEVVRLIYETFSTTNPLWTRFKTTFEEIAPFLRWRLKPSLATQTSSILILEGRIVACQIGVDYVDYWNQRKEGFELPDMFKVITEFHNQAMGTDLDPQLPRNTCVINHYTAVLPEFQNQGFYPALNRNGFRVCQFGYTNSYTITTNPITQGVNNIRTVRIEDPNHILNQIQFDLIEVPLIYGDTSKPAQKNQEKNIVAGAQ